MSIMGPKKREALEEAIDEAEKFLEVASFAIRRHNDESEIYFGTKETAALNRSSMDLTRALSAYRKIITQL